MTRLLGDLWAVFDRVDTVPGWDTRGNPSFAPACVVCHWTAGPRDTTKRASLAVVTNGRPGLPGPLCNVYLDRAGIPVIVAAGRANHAGAGGWRGLVGNSAAYGIEAESGGDGDWTPAQREAYPRLVAAMLAGLGRGAEWACGHSEWAPTRKIDVRDWPMAAMRAEAADLLEDDMPTAADIAEAVYHRFESAQLMEDGSRTLRSLWEQAGSAPSARDIALEVTERTVLIGPDGRPLMLRGVLEAAARAAVAAADAAGRPVSVDVDATAVAAALLPAVTGAVGAVLGDVDDALAGRVADELAARLIQPVPSVEVQP